MSLLYRSDSYHNAVKVDILISN